MQTSSEKNCIFSFDAYNLGKTIFRLRQVLTHCRPVFHFYTLWNVPVEVSQILENQQIRVKATKCMDLEPRPQPSKVKK